MSQSTDEPVTTHDAEDDIRNRDIKLYINGEIVHRNEARVSVYDSGFMLGDGTVSYTHLTLPTICSV